MPASVSDSDSDSIAISGSRGSELGALRRRFRLPTSPQMRTSICVPALHNLFNNIGIDDLYALVADVYYATFQKIRLLTYLGILRLLRILRLVH